MAENDINKKNKKFNLTVAFKNGTTLTGTVVASSTTAPGSALDDFATYLKRNTGKPRAGKLMNGQLVVAWDQVAGMTTWEEEL